MFGHPELTSGDEGLAEAERLTPIQRAKPAESRGGLILKEALGASFFPDRPTAPANQLLAPCGRIAKLLVASAIPFGCHLARFVYVQSRRIAIEGHSHAFQQRRASRTRQAWKAGIRLLCRRAWRHRHRIAWLQFVALKPFKTSFFPMDQDSYSGKMLETIQSCVGNEQAYRHWSIKLAVFGWCW